MKARIIADLEVTVSVPWDVIVEVPTAKDLPENRLAVLQAAGCFPTIEELTVSVHHDDCGALFDSGQECSVRSSTVEWLPRNNKDVPDVHIVKQMVVSEEVYRAYVAAEKRKQANAPLPGQMTLPGV